MKHSDEKTLISLLRVLKKAKNKRFNKVKLSKFYSGRVEGVELSIHVFVDKYTGKVKFFPSINYTDVPLKGFLETAKVMKWI